MSQDKEALECAKKRYSLWANFQIRNPKMLVAAFALIESLVNNNEFAEAAMISRTALEMINDINDDFIPSKDRPHFQAEVLLSLSLYYVLSCTPILSLIN